MKKFIHFHYKVHRSVCEASELLKSSRFIGVTGSMGRPVRMLRRPIWRRKMEDGSLMITTRQKEEQEKSAS